MQRTDSDFPVCCRSSAPANPCSSPRSWQNTDITLRLSCDPSPFQTGKPRLSLKRAYCPCYAKNNPCPIRVSVTVMWALLETQPESAFSPRAFLEELGSSHPSVGPEAPPLLPYTSALSPLSPLSRHGTLTSAQCPHRHIPSLEKSTLFVDINQGTL